MNMAKIPIFDMIGAAVIAPAVLAISSLSLHALKFVLGGLEGLATEKTRLNEPFSLALPVLKKLHYLLNEKIFGKQIKTDFNSIMAMATVIGLIAVTSAISNLKADSQPQIHQNHQNHQASKKKH